MAKINFNYERGLLPVSSWMIVLNPDLPSSELSSKSLISLRFIFFMLPISSGRNSNIDQEKYIKLQENLKLDTYSHVDQSEHRD